MESETRAAVEGQTLKDAIEQACETLNIQKTDLEYKLDAEHFRGGADTVRIIAWRRNRRELEVGDAAKELLEGILARIGFGGKVEVESGETSIKVVLISDDPAVILENGAQTLDALQHIVNKALIRNRNEKRIVIDLENFREKRENNLRAIAQRVCERVEAGEEAVTLRPMNAYDRRLIHIEVALHSALSSESIGEGQLKRIRVSKVELCNVEEVADEGDSRVDEGR